MFNFIKIYFNFILNLSFNYYYIELFCSGPEGRGTWVTQVDSVLFNWGKVYIENQPCP